MRSSLALLLGTLPLAGCLFTTPAGTHLATDPPGALIVVNGRESGNVTPAMLHLSEGRDHTLRFELPGYLPATVEMDSARRVTLVPWFGGSGFETGFTFPSFLPWYDFWAPVRVDNALSPSRVFVKLVPAGDGPGAH